MQLIGDIAGDRHRYHLADRHLQPRDAPHHLSFPHLDFELDVDGCPGRFHDVHPTVVVVSIADRCRPPTRGHHK